MRSLRTLLAMLYFAAIFFAAVPWALLELTGSDAVEGLRNAGSLSLLPLFVSLLALLWQIIYFVRVGEGTPVPLDPPRHLIQSGIYRWSRNPMYLLYVFVIVCEAIALRSFVLGGYALAFFLLAYAYVVCFEEPSLRRRFGERYERYRHQVPRWIPFNAPH